LSYRKQHSGKPQNEQVKVEANREPVNRRHQVIKPPRKVTTVVIKQLFCLEGTENLSSA